MIVSIIVPVYNTPLSIFENCLNSICNQTYRKLDVIVVNDGSEEELALKYDFLIKKVNKIKDPEMKFRIVNKSNGGVSTARNLGISLAEGDFISFMDSDDCIHKDFISVLIKIIIEKNVKMCFCGMRHMRTDGDIYSNSDIEGQISIEKKRIEECVKGYVTAKLYSKKLLQDIRFDEDIKYFEDYLFDSKVYNKVDECGYTDCKLYLHRFNKYSATTNMKSNGYLSGITALERALEIPFVKKYSLISTTQHKEECRLKYMIALVEEKNPDRKELITVNRRKFKENMWCFKDIQHPKYVLIALRIIDLPLPVFIMFLKIFCFLKNIYFNIRAIINKYNK